MNKVILMGNITKDAEIKYSSDNQTKIARTSMALNRGKDKNGNDKGADFVNLIAFGSKADFFERFVKKGRRFLVEGRIQTGSYKDRDGKTVYTTDFITDVIEFADSKPDSTDSSPMAQLSDFITTDDGEDLPFV